MSLELASQKYKILIFKKRRRIKNNPVYNLSVMGIIKSIYWIQFF